MYFNRNVPRNCNWAIAYPKNLKAAVVFNDDSNQFERKSTVEVIDEKFENMMHLLQPLIEQIYQEDEINNHLNNQQKRNLKEYYSHFGVSHISTESPVIYEAIQDLGYNARTVPMTSWKQQGLDGKHLSLKF